MTNFSKIRWALLLITLGLFISAFVVNFFVSKADFRERRTKSIQRILTQKDAYIANIISDKNRIEQLIRINTIPDTASSIVNDFSKKGIGFQLYKNDQILFWTDNIASFFNNKKEGKQALYSKNAVYYLVNKTYKNYKLSFYVLIKQDLPFENPVFNSNNKGFLIKEKDTDVVLKPQKGYFDIKLNGKNYLFSIKYKQPVISKTYSFLETALWILAFITLVLTINSFCKKLADDGYPIYAILTLILSIILIRVLSIKYSFPPIIYDLDFFNPNIYASNRYFNSLADLYINLFLFLWIIEFITQYQRKIFRKVKTTFLKYFILIGSWIIILFVSVALNEIIKNLVLDSKINFKVANLIGLDKWSILGIFLLALLMIVYYLILKLIITGTTYLEINIKEKITLLLSFFVTYFIHQALNTSFYSSLFFMMLFVFLVMHIVYKRRGSVNFPIAVLFALITSTIACVQLSDVLGIKEKEVRKILAEKLEATEDPRVIISLSHIENKILEDTFVKQFFNSYDVSEEDLNEYLGSVYFGNALEEYNFSISIFSADKISANTKLLNFKNLVKNNAVKVSKNFYKVQNTFGIQNYFAILPFEDDNKIIGTLVIDLKHEYIKDFVNIPYFLKKGSTISTHDFDEYSYAFYQDNQLIYQSGDYVYDLKFKEYPEKIKNYLFINKDGFNHLIYKASLNKTILISKENYTFLREIASVSIYFIIFLFFSSLVLSYKVIVKKIIKNRYSFRLLSSDIQSINTRMLYKTRIQIVMVLAVVCSLIIVGLISFSYISIQYKEQQKVLIQQSVKTITKGFVNFISEKGANLNYEKKKEYFKEFSKFYFTDINLFDENGLLINSTQPKIYSLGIISNRMNSEAYINLKLRQKSEFLQEETIGALKYSSAYMPVEDNNNKILGYLQIPYFANENDFNQKIGNFLNLLVNIYILVFVAIGFVAFAVANQITTPLELIQESMSKTSIGRKNKAIPWRRNDEIGDLIKEYNKMLLVLEDSANKMLKIEREAAWKEMAKQVAHEIKNPLTPLRLGIQMIERSWKDKDPNFEEKFKRFCISFIEQIDKLNIIASQFSNFAKLPEPEVERVYIGEVINEAKEIYKYLDDIEVFSNEVKLIGTIIKADKQQLLDVFDNLFSNSIKSMKEGKEGYIAIKCKIKEEYICIEFEDNGKGIPLELRDKIFTPNFTTRSSGTGLGLAFVKQAINNIGGKISFTSEIDVGTTFYIELPLAD